MSNTAMEPAANGTSVVRQETILPETVEDWSRDRIELVKRTFCKGATDDEFELFIGTCRRLGLSPEARQVFAVKRFDTSAGREVMSIQVSIDGFRLFAERTGKYDGQIGPHWCGPDGVWQDVWLSDTPPAAARVAVLRKDWREPLYAVARYKSYVQTKRDGSPNAMWTKLPDTMLAKVAESLALRKAFPQEFSGLYTVEEMGQADNPDPVTHDIPRTPLPPAVPSSTASASRPQPERDDNTAALMSRARELFGKAGMGSNKDAQAFANQHGLSLKSDVQSLERMIEALEAHLSGAPITEEPETVDTETGEIVGAHYHTLSVVNANPGETDGYILGAAAEDPLEDQAKWAEWRDLVVTAEMSIWKDRDVRAAQTEQYRASWGFPSLIQDFTSGQLEGYWNRLGQLNEGALFSEAETQSAADRAQLMTGGRRRK